MNTQSIAGMSGYLPLLRMERAAMLRAMAFSRLGGEKQGQRAVANWDEDPLTLAVEAARPIASGSAPEKVVFASTSAPFYERGHAPLLVDALALSQQTRTNDVAGSRRCAVAALLDALLSNETTLVAAGDKRPTQPGSVQHLAFGDGGAAALVADAGAARLIGHASIAHDFIDFYTSRQHPTPYAYEERFVKSVTTEKIIGPTIRAACAHANILPEQIAHAAVHEPLPGCWPAIARHTGMTASNSATEVYLAAGDLGAGHALFALALAFDKAKPGDILLLAGFGSGCDALIFQMDSPMPGASQAAMMLSHGQMFNDHVRFLSLTGCLELDWGMRAEFTQKMQATAWERYGRDMTGFIGGRDESGNVQFPKSTFPVRPNALHAERMEDIRLADEQATIVSLTADRLSFSPDPPFCFGLVQFDNGARVMMELTDQGKQPFAVGDRVRAQFRIKSQDKQRGSRTYFWKAVPNERQHMGQ